MAPKKAVLPDEDSYDSPDDSSDEELGVKAALKGAGSGSSRKVQYTLTNKALGLCAPIILVIILVDFFVLPETEELLQAAGPDESSLPPGNMECLIWGDPQVLTWDRMRTELHGSGDYWLVKSETVEIQGRFLPRSATSAGESSMTEIGIGGSTVAGNSIIVGALVGGAIMVNGEKVLQSMPSVFDLPYHAGTISLNVTSIRGSIDPFTKGQPKNVVDVRLSSGVTVEILRWTDHMDARIWMPDDYGRDDGVCGVHDLDMEDDAARAIYGRGKMQVKQSDRLFLDKPHIIWTQEEELLLNQCQEEKRYQAREDCEKSLGLPENVDGQSLLQIKECMMDVCFGVDHHETSGSSEEERKPAPGTPSPAVPAPSAPPAPGTPPSAAAPPSTAAPPLAPVAAAPAPGAVAPGALPSTPA